MKETNNKRKEEILASAVRSFPIYEVQQICFESRRYPRRRIRLQRVGLFQTKESAEDAMHAYIKHEKECCETWDEDYYADSLGYYIDEVLVHNKYSEFYENERSQRCYSYTADGELNDCAVLDEFGWFRGRKLKDVRFKEGDIVEIMGFDYSELVSGNSSLSPREEYLVLTKLKQSVPLHGNFGYAVTVWKAQGSEWDKVLLYPERSWPRDTTERRKFLYTGVTRARQKLVVAKE